MAQITKAGYVYIISNIGLFAFDVHAIVNTEKVSELESSLHKYFDQKSVNKVNFRKEYFNVLFQEMQGTCNEMGHEKVF